MKNVVLASLIIIGVAFTLVSFELDGNLLTLHMKAENQLPIDLIIKSIDGEVIADGEQVGVIYMEKPITLQKRSESDFDLFVRFTHTLDEFRDLYPETPAIIVKVTAMVCIEPLCVHIPLQRTITAEEVIEWKT